MVKSAAGVCWYQDHLITRTLDSITGKFDYIFVIDGRFALNPSTSDYSDESLREKVRQYPDVILIDFVGSEQDKRDQYLLQCKKYDVEVLCIIDSDEYINKNTDWKLFWDNLPQKQGTYSVLVMPNDIYLPRIWIKPYNFRYYQAHCIFQDMTTGEVRSSGDSGKIKLPGLILEMGKDAPRTQEYLDNTRRYQELMIEAERAIRKQIHP